MYQITYRRDFWSVIVGVRDEVIHSQRNSRERKKNSHVVKLINNSTFNVGVFVADLGKGDCCYAIGPYLEVKGHNFIAALPNAHHFVAWHLTAVLASIIYRKCLFMNVLSLG